MIAPAVVVDVLQVITAIQLSPPSTLGIIPSDEELKNKLTNTASNWEAFVYEYLNGKIREYYSEMGLGNVLSKLMRRESDLIGYTRRAPIDLDDKWKRKRTVYDLEDKLYGETILAADKNKRIGFSDNIKKGYDIARNFINTDPPVLPTLSDINTTIAVIKALRAFEGCMIRVKASWRAAVDSNTFLWDVLTLYQIEGHLVVPSSKATLDKLIPPIETDFRYDLIHKRRKTFFIPNVTKGVWLAEKSKFKKFFNNVTPDFIRVICLLDWFLVITGMDMLTQLLGKSGTQDPDVIGTNFALFSANQCKIVGLDSSSDKAKQRFAELLNNLAFEEVTHDNQTILKVVTIDPIKQVSMILTEGLILMKALSIKRLKGLEYLSYHTQDTIFSKSPDKLENEDLNEDKYTKIIISAFLAASKTTDAHFKELKKSLQDIPFPKKLDKNYGIVLKQIEDNLPATFDPDLFVEFINTAGKDQWSSWQEHRANLSRFNILKDYYWNLSP